MTVQAAHPSMALLVSGSSATQAHIPTGHIPTGHIPTEVEPGRDLASQPRGNGRLWFDSIFIVGQISAADHDFAYLVHVLHQPETDARRQVITVTDTTTGWFKQHTVMLSEHDLHWDRGALDLRTPDLTWTGDLDHQVITANTPWGSLHLELEPVGPVLYYGGLGTFKLLGAQQYQYALPQMLTTGTLTVEGRSWEVRGNSWLDRQWGAQPDLQINRWSWMNLAMPNGEKLALWDARSADGAGPEESWATVLRPDGTHELVTVTPLAQTAGRFWRSQTGRAVYPTQWTVTIPSRDATLTVTSSVLGQEVPGLGPTSAYEGTATVSGTYAGEDVRGLTYVEQLGNWAG